MRRKKQSSVGNNVHEHHHAQSHTRTVQITAILSEPGTVDLCLIHSMGNHAQLVKWNFRNYLSQSVMEHCKHFDVLMLIRAKARPPNSIAANSNIVTT